MQEKKVTSEFFYSEIKRIEKKLNELIILVNKYKMLVDHQINFLTDEINSFK